MRMVDQGGKVLHKRGSLCSHVAEAEAGAWGASLPSVIVLHLSDQVSLLDHLRTLQDLPRFHSEKNSFSQIILGHVNFLRLESLEFGR